ncbi:malate dehydrogenase (oxaloacetate-decarboxylating)(NADP+) [Limimonas halophila]|uniref:Malate dehydrogenase (Oxaloacetate-decarboxylating)(NADP+) n=1 Tax=Limimonas halophila TaxID=1082479 RepID=A0A1G7UNE8_9PROT|nr:NADP-dependent malic enzyme [Limimonas halophila]SDG48868.1 malate dehydrogenase (oxaloacetate-decarboxylating)(NADP+) [Limimonas halophila]
MADDLRDAALAYHREPVPGKIEVTPTKPLGNQRDLALAYSPGVAAACQAIEADPQEAANLTARGNLVAVVTNGSAVLGLGGIGPLAAKPVMEGKGVLFKKFAGIDVFDLELAQDDPDKFIEAVAALEPTFGGVNLEDIKAPECFQIEDALRERMNIPVFHDDQHGTAIIVGAAIYNALRLRGKRFDEVKLVCAGAGAAALACLNLLQTLGLKRENIWVCDIHGVVHAGREAAMDPWKAQYAQETDARTLDEVIEGADIFLGLSAPRVLNKDMVRKMSQPPIIMALANPEPEIMPDDAREVSPEAIIATGRSDYPNQVNNVLCFPFMFRGALDVGASTINEEMKAAAVKALADLALAEPSEVVATAYGGEDLRFGPDYLIPRPFDPRLILELAPAVAKAAMDSGVAHRPIEDFQAYTQRLSEFVFRSGMVMKPVFERAAQDPKRVIYAEGEDSRILRAAQVVVDEGLAQPILIGRPDVIEMRIERLGLRIRLGEDVGYINPHSDPRYNAYWSSYHQLMQRKGVKPDDARTIVRTNQTVIAALAVYRGDADAMICGVEGIYRWHVTHVEDVLGKAPGVKNLSALSLLLTPQGTYFMSDTYVSDDPSAEEVVEMTLQSAQAVRAFGITPKVALLSHANFGNAESATARKMREAVRQLHTHHPELEVEGEMHGDAALSEEVRYRIFPNSKLSGTANLLIMPTIDAANISMNLVRILGEGLSIGPLLLGAARPAHVLTPSVTARGVVNMSAVAVVDAQKQDAAAEDVRPAMST